MGMKEDEERRLDGGVVVVNPKPNKGLTSKAVDWLEQLIVKLMYDSSQPHHYLSVARRSKQKGWHAETGCSSIPNCIMPKPGKEFEEIKKGPGPFPPSFTIMGA
ncbi:hypothetical protein RHGRI_021419 [Rhododendron griersonianum]|uniref:Uncharacterized protein n=1 Tax=Rhododendron griersonianum TaxID=479676 RepID=A0AAV6JP31_9ERIC|nr:hypothetical protein RHGRI_021419 [Rhododendron griersonianum]